MVMANKTHQLHIVDSFCEWYSKLKVVFECLTLFHHVHPSVIICKQYKGIPLFQTEQKMQEMAEKAFPSLFTYSQAFTHHNILG